MYLSTHLIVPYFITPNGTIKRPEHLIAWWSRIFSFCVPDDNKHRTHLRFLCRLFRDALQPPPLYTIFPHPNYPTLNGLLDALNRLYQTQPTRVPHSLYIMEGTYHVAVYSERYLYGDENYVRIEYPIHIIGAGQDKTFICDGGFFLAEREWIEEEKRVVLSDFTVRQAKECGFYCRNSLSFLCHRITFDQCRCEGVLVCNSQGIVRDCVVTACGSSGIYSEQSACIALEGSRTKVHGNCTEDCFDDYGLKAEEDYMYDDDEMGETAASPSSIQLLPPLTKEMVAFNNGGGGNWSGGL